MRVHGVIDEVAPQPPQPRQCPILVRSSEPAVAEDIRDQDRRDFSGPAMARPQAPCGIAQKPVRAAPLSIESIGSAEGNPEPMSERRFWVEEPFGLVAC
jgi:hypothetical protein